MSWLPSVLSVAPTEEPVTLAELKAMVRVDGTDEDTLITSMGMAARGYIEQMTGTGLITQTRALKCSAWSDLGSLPVGPAQSVSSVKYLDTDGAEQTLSTSVYEVVTSGRRALIRLKASQSWPPTFTSADAIRIEAVIGYGLAAAVPEDIKHAIKLTVAQWFDIRGDTVAERSVTPTSVPNGVAALIANYRIY